MATVTFNGTRLSDADTNTGWGNFNASGPSPASEPQLKYQGNNAVNKKITSTTSRSGVSYTHGSTVNMAAGSFPLWFSKMKVGDAGDLNGVYGCEMAVGSGSGAYYSYNVSGTGANNDQYSSGYNSQGGLAEGYIVTTINPNIAQWREGTTGSPTLTAVDFFGVAAQFVTGGAKSENVACDAIDVGVGLDYNGTLFSFEDGPDTDQDVFSNRWGAACRNGSVITLRGLHRVGTSTTTSGTDTSTVLFPDGYHGNGDCGVEDDTTRSSVVYDGSYTCLGRVYGADDTRGVWSWVGNDTNTATHAGTWNNWASFSLRTSQTLDGANVETSELIQGGSTIQNSRIRCDSVAGVATCSDIVAGNLSNVTWQQVGAGHAIEINTPGTYSFTSLFFDGFGADGTNSAAVYNNSGGVVTINVTGSGDTPTVRNGVGASTTINNAVTITLDGLIAGSRVYIANTTDSVVLFNEVEATTTFTDTINYTGDKSLLIRVRNASSATKYKPYQATGTLTSNGFSLTVNQVLDE